jgi:hypothetical protein
LSFDRGGQVSDDDEYSAFDDYVRSLPPPYDFYVHGARGHTDLEFLRGAGPSRSVGVNLGDRIASLDGVRHLRPDLRELSLSAIWVRHPSLTPLRRFEALADLGVGGDGQFRDFEAISQLPSLRRLWLNRRQFDVRTLLPITELRHVEISLGRPTSPIAALAELPHLSWLELNWIRSLTDLAGIGDSTMLQRLDIGQLSNLGRLPDLSHATALRSVAIEKCRLIDDLSPLAAAPALEQLILVDMPQMTPRHLQPLVGHPTLKYASVGTGSFHRNAAIRDVLQLPEWPGPIFPD